MTEQTADSSGQLVEGWLVRLLQSLQAEIAQEIVRHLTTDMMAKIILVAVHNALVQQGLGVREEEKASTSPRSTLEYQPKTPRRRAKKIQAATGPAAATTDAPNDDAEWQDKLGRLGVKTGDAANDSRQGALPLVEDQPPRREPGDDTDEEQR